MNRIVEATKNRTIEKVSTREIHERVTAVFDALLAVLEQDGRVSWPGFGVLKVVERKPRMVRNPITGERFEKGAYKTIKFRPTKDLIADLNPRIIKRRELSKKKAKADAAEDNTPPSTEAADVADTSVDTAVS